MYFQGKLELLTGATPANMKLEVYNKENKLVCKIDNDNAMLGSYPVDDGMRLHVSYQEGGLGGYFPTVSS